MGLFIKKQDRSKLVGSFLQSKRAERTSKNSLLDAWASKRWHHSPEGRKRHRQLGRYLALRRPVPQSGLFGFKDSFFA